MTSKIPPQAVTVCSSVHVPGVSIPAVLRRPTYAAAAHATLEHVPLAASRTSDACETPLGVLTLVSPGDHTAATICDLSPLPHEVPSPSRTRMPSNCSTEREQKQPAVASPKSASAEQRPNTPMKRAPGKKFKPPKFQRTRQVNQAKAIGESLASAHQKAEGAVDAAAELAASLPKPPTHLNPLSDSNQHTLTRRLIYAPSLKAPAWPILAFLLGPYAALLLLAMYLQSVCFAFLALAFMLCWLPLSWKMVEYNDKQQFVNLVLDDPSPLHGIRTIGDCVEVIHNTPAFPSSKPLACYAIHLMQCMVPYLSARTHVASGIALPVCEGTASLVTEDVRAANHTGLEASKLQVEYHAHCVLSFCSGWRTLRISCPAMSDQFVTRLLPLSPSDREIQAESMTARVTNLMIESVLYKEVVRGTADSAVAYCANADFASATLKASRQFETNKISVLWLWPVLATALVLCSRPRTLGDVFGVSLSTNGGFWGWVLTAIAVALFEEACKSLLALLAPGGRLVIGPLFGALELLFAHGANPAAVPAALMHAATGALSFRRAVITHALFNIAVVLILTGSLTVTHESTSMGLWDPALPTLLCEKVRNANYHDLLALSEQHRWFDPRRCHFEAYDQPSDQMYDFGDYMGCSPVLMALLVMGVVGCYGRRRVQLAALNTAVVLFAVGYRFNEVLLPSVSAHDATVRWIPSLMPACRVSPACTLGFCLRRIAPPFPDFFHAPTVLHGCLLRFCATPPRPKRGLLRRLRRFAIKWIKKNVKPVDPNSDVSVETWLANTDYPAWRKCELLRVWLNQPTVRKKDLRNKGFAKREFYTQFKPARGINSRSDIFKCATGPFFKLIESQIYDQPCFDGTRLIEGTMGPFIKHIPTHLRPEFLQKYLGSYAGPFYETDYSQFEKHFTHDVMHSLELALYKHALLHFPAIYRLIESALAGTNTCDYKQFQLKVPAKRMSGDMCTSLGNGFSNLMLFMFAAHRRGGTAIGVVEGDDALFVSSVPLSKQDFLDLGFVIKIEVFSDLYSSSFCGMCMSSDGVILRDPVRTIPKFGWSLSPRRLGSQRTRAGLLRARALSLAYESPQCPVLHALAKRALDATAGVKAIFEYSYHNSEVESWAAAFLPSMATLLRSGPTLEARVAFANKFGWSIRAQLRAEEIIATWDGSPLDHPFINSCFSNCRDMFYFADSFVSDSAAAAANAWPSTSR